MPILKLDCLQSPYRYRPNPMLRDTAKKVSGGPTIMNISRQRGGGCPEKSAKEITATTVVAKAIASANQSSGFLLSFMNSVGVSKKTIRVGDVRFHLWHNSLCS